MPHRVILGINVGLRARCTPRSSGLPRAWVVWSSTITCGMVMVLMIWVPLMCTFVVLIPLYGPDMVTREIDGNGLVKWSSPVKQLLG